LPEKYSFTVTIVRKDLLIVEVSSHLKLSIKNALTLESYKFMN